ncbi:MAG: hypothetical protein HAW67_05170 [Endozoicomonadaceae bacterium]|nr:hypothetical protein [Endozoicomonadaceae bacterium]
MTKDKITKTHWILFNDKGYHGQYNVVKEQKEARQFITITEAYEVLRKLLSRKNAAQWQGAKVETHESGKVVTSVSIGG